MIKSLLQNGLVSSIVRRSITDLLMPKRPKVRSTRRGGSVATKRVKLSDSVFSLPGPVSREASTMAALSADTLVLPTPAQSDNDKKEYRVIRLKNGLTALLIADTVYPLDKLDEEEKTEVEEDMESEEEESDDEDGEDDEEDEDMEEENEEDMAPKRRPVEATGLKMSAAGLCVHMGSFSDPDDIPGLAHFLEHMVFMGSEKFPDENSFDAFNRKHGGNDNASTDCETTIFYFETPRRHFHEGLDRFAQFFISPLMKQNSMEREREAVDSEFQMALPDDYSRRQQIFGGLSRDGHPMAKFMWGNIKSLVPAGMKDEEIHKRLHKFRDRHYSAQYMCLAVQSQHTLDTIQGWVEETFSDVPKNGLERESFDSAALSEPFKTDKFSKIYRFIPVQNVYQVDLTWSLPPLMSQYRVKPLHYLSWIIGHEGRGSLISYLRRKVWALALTAGNDGDGFEFNSTYSVFAITVTLTKEGYHNMDKVLAAVFGYLKMMKNNPPNERIYNEIQKIEELDFRFGEEKQPSDNVETLCENMQFYPPERYLDGDDLMFEFEPKVITACLDKIGEDNVNIFIMAKDIPGDSLDHVEEWFGTAYSVTDIPSSWVAGWRQPDPELVGQFHLPEDNIFIAEDTGLVKEEEAGTTAAGRFPVRILQDDQGELFYKRDVTFRQPRGYIYYLLRSPLQMESVEQAAKLDLLASCLLQNLIEDVYPADIAQLRYSVYSAETGLVIKVSGLSDKLPLLLETIMKHVDKFETVILEEMYGAVMEQLRKNYHNHSIKPSKLVRDVRLGILQDVYWSPREKLNIVRNITCDQVKEFAKQFKSRVYLQGLVQGNITPDRARTIDNIVRSRLSQNPAKDRVREIRCNEVKEGEVIIRVDSLNKRDANTMVTNYYQAGPGDLRHHTLLEVITMAMEEPVFDVLRTQQQLGYHVFNTLRNTYGVLGFSVTVNTQATKFSPDHVDDSIEKFLELFVKEHLDNEAEVLETVASLAKLKMKADVTLEEEVARNWGEITGREYLFDRFEKEAEILADLGVDEVKTYFLKLVKGSPSCRKLSVQVVGTPEPGDPTEEDDSVGESVDLVVHKGEKMTTDLDQLKKSLKTHPVLYIVK